VAPKHTVGSAPTVEGWAVAVDPALAEPLSRFQVAIPSWGFSPMGTRFATFTLGDEAKDVYGRIDRAAAVQRALGMTPGLALHFPWDRTEDLGALGRYIRDRGLRVEAVNPNTFQDPSYRLGSVAHADPAVRGRAREHLLWCVEACRQLGAPYLSLWFADGTNYPGQADFRRRHEALVETLQPVHAALPAGCTMLVEYKPFEPAFYHTDVADWGTAALICRRLGPQAKVIVDTGHHLQGHNVECTVALLQQAGLLGGFHLNNRKYADDDLMTGSIDPYGLFLIFRELVKGERLYGQRIESVSYCLDQSANIEAKLPAMVLSVMQTQEAFCKALLVDEAALEAAERGGDVIRSQQVLREAFLTDVRPLLAEFRRARGWPEDPLEHIRAEAVGAARA
jgi:L-rhamnose isomerase/sugar isomerase